MALFCPDQVCFWEGSTDDCSTVLYPAFYAAFSSLIFTDLGTLITFRVPLPAILADFITLNTTNMTLSSW